MKNKRTILLIAILSSACIGLAQAQQNAQATMTITAEVIRGGSAVADLKSDMEIGEDGTFGTLGSLTLPGEGSTVTTQEEIDLENELGEKIFLPVSAQSTRRGQQMDIHLNTRTDELEGRILQGVYSGSLTTTIAYM